MNSWTTPEFWAAFAALSPAVRATAQRAYRLWLLNPRHGSLRFERKGRFWSARVGSGHRALAVSVPGGFLWFWIGPHDEYERMLHA